MPNRTALQVALGCGGLLMAAAEHPGVPPPITTSNGMLLQRAALSAFYSKQSTSAASTRSTFAWLAECPINPIRQALPAKGPRPAPISML